jgi:endonuclease/exonuclease/phosphatase family metal-dependent hydrolase
MKIKTKKTIYKKYKHHKKNNTHHNIQKGGSISVHALTYNLSWASQKKVVAGSEQDFVEHCKNINRDCYKKALLKIKELHTIYKFDVIGIQEVEDVNLVTSICKNTGLKGWYRGATWKSSDKIYSGCAIIWNTNTLGTMKTGKTVNLAQVDEDNECDARTCCIVTTSKNINLIVAHFPWLNTRNDVLTVAEIINSHITSNGPIIILADTNDSLTLISKETPLIIKDRFLSHGLTKKEAQEFIKSCCWHKKDHAHYKHLTDTGDYILSENVALIEIPIPYPTNDKGETTLYSDHMPVAATIILSDNTNRTRSAPPYTRKSRSRTKSAPPYTKKSSNTKRSRSRTKSAPF